MKFSNIIFGKYKYVSISVVIAVLLISIFLVLKVFYFPENETIPKNTDLFSVLNDENTPSVFAGDSNILFVCNSDTVGEPLFALIFDFHIYSETIRVTPLDLNVSDGEKTYAEQYIYGGIDSLITSVEKVRKSSIDRYMIIDKDGIGDFTDFLGSISMYVDEDYTYLASDKSYEVKSGSNELASEMLYTYLKIISAESDGLTRLSDTVCTIVNTYLKKMDPDEAQDLFGEICNCVTTDITISDFYSWENDIKYLLSHNTKCVSYEKEE